MIDENFTYNVAYYYAEIDSDGYCVGLSQLSGSVENDSLIRIESMDDSYFNRKYDRETESWTEEYLQVPEPEPVITLGDIKADTTPIKEVTSLTSEDALTIMEYQAILDEKLDLILSKLQA